MKRPIAFAIAIAALGSGCTTTPTRTAPAVRTTKPPPKPPPKAVQKPAPKSEQKRANAPAEKPRGDEIPELPPPPPPPDLVSMRAGFARSPSAGSAPLIWPVDGVVVSLFGKRDGQRHDGIDVGAPEGSAVWAAADGRVLFSGEQPGYGLLVILAHEGDLSTVYAHNAANLVREGEAVRQGDPIAQVGQSGGQITPALHFEVRLNKDPINPLGRLPP